MQIRLQDLTEDFFQDVLCGFSLVQNRLKKIGCIYRIVEIIKRQKNVCFCSVLQNTFKKKKHVASVIR